VLQKKLPDRTAIVGASRIECVFVPDIVLGAGKGKPERLIAIERRQLDLLRVGT
jgi:hypothetical protein